MSDSALKIAPLPEQEPFALERSLGFLVHRLAETLEARLMSRLAPDALSLPAYRVLAVLLNRGECRSIDLAEAAGLEPPTAGKAWQPAQLLRLNRGPRPTPASPGTVPETESIS